jgi:hypothetical protein
MWIHINIRYFEIPRHRLGLSTSFFTSKAPRNILYFQKYHWNHSKFIFHSPNFFSPHLFNLNTESSDSCAEILRIISSSFSSYSSSYDFCIYVIICLSIRRICFETDVWILQDQLYKDFKNNYTRTLIFYFQRNEASVLQHIAPIYFLVYFVVVVLHARVNECAPMLGFY